MSVRCGELQRLPTQRNVMRRNVLPFLLVRFDALPSRLLSTQDRDWVCWVEVGVTDVPSCFPADMYLDWSARDERFREIGPYFTGARMMRQVSSTTRRKTR